MKISMHTMAVDTFAPMLESLGEILGKAVPYAESKQLDLVNARLAPDMFTLAQQVEEACFYASDGLARLTGKTPVERQSPETTLPALRTKVAKTVGAARAVPASAFEGAEERDCSLEIPGLVIEMDGLRFLRSWSIPHFYFHVVTAYDILRHNGLTIGKQEYLSQVGQFIRQK